MFMVLRSKETKHWDIHGETLVDDNTYFRVDNSNTIMNEDHECSYSEMVLDSVAPDFFTSNHEEELNAKGNFFIC